MDWPCEMSPPPSNAPAADSSRDARRQAPAPAISELELRASAAEREGLRELCAAYRRLVLERRVGAMPEPTRGDELCTEVRSVRF